jgi:hypothetical protein
LAERDTVLRRERGFSWSGAPKLVFASGDADGPAPSIEFERVVSILDRPLKDNEKDSLTELHHNHWLRGRIVFNGIEGPILARKAKTILQQLDGRLPFEVSGEDAVWKAIKYHLLHSQVPLIGRDVIDETWSAVLRERLEVLVHVYLLRRHFRGLLAFSVQGNWVALVQDVHRWCETHGIATGFSSRANGSPTPILRSLVQFVDEAAPREMRRMASEDPGTIIKAIGRSLKYHRSYDPDAHR